MKETGRRANFEQALIDRGGTWSAPNAISFDEHGNRLTFSWTGKEFEGPDGSMHLEVTVELDGEEVDLSDYLGKENRKLSTGDKHLVDAQGCRTRCIDVCDEILQDFRCCAGVFSKHRPAQGTLLLHEAMAVVLLKCKDRTASLTHVSRDIARRGLYAQQSGGKAPPDQVRLRAMKYPELFDLVPADKVRLK